MKTSMGNYFIKPTEQWREGDKDSLGSSLQHAIYRVSSTSSSLNNDSNFGDHVKNRNCGVIGKSSFIYLFWSIHSFNTLIQDCEWYSLVNDDQLKALVKVNLYTIVRDLAEELGKTTIEEHLKVITKRKKFDNLIIIYQRMSSMSLTSFKANVFIMKFFEPMLNCTFVGAFLALHFIDILSYLLYSGQAWTCR